MREFENIINWPAAECEKEARQTKMGICQDLGNQDPVRQAGLIRSDLRAPGSSMPTVKLAGCWSTSGKMGKPSKNGEHRVLISAHSGMTAIVVYPKDLKKKG